MTHFRRPDSEIKARLDASKKARQRGKPKIRVRDNDSGTRLVKSGMESFPKCDIVDNSRVS
jgi:hypothetical protein